MCGFDYGKNWQPLLIGDELFMPDHGNALTGLDRPRVRERFIHCTDGHNLPPRPRGYMLLALAEAFFYAPLTRRTLVVDWRDTKDLNDGRTTLFQELFECENVLGVSIRTEHIDELILGKSRLAVERQFYESAQCSDGWSCRRQTMESRWRVLTAIPVA
jgi:hypothetical protein